MSVLVFQLGHVLEVGGVHGQLEVLERLVAVDGDEELGRAEARDRALVARLGAAGLALAAVGTVGVPGG